ncbi:MAG: hypothetical protein HFF34_09325 [Oscillospiraceae bacterium]|jgi:hypothetical protein|nr:hypothetical protein [Oscillospiraceae bacterium]MCI9393835.1 hypothetical protein [Oscillospiraceae bacterium]MCI9581555.1 hypothetical protein [Oscillospiraceae bacterium]
MTIPFDLTAPCLYFPVRHHSPACSLHLERTLEAYQPDCVLVEGPENAGHLLPLLKRPESRPPLALYYALRDEKGLLGEPEEVYKCYYPFLECSPELVALRWAERAGAEGRFIDLSYGQILLSCAQDRGLRRPGERRSYQDEGRFSHGEFLERLCERTGLRSYSEFWEKYFEVNGLTMDTADFVHQMHTYCTLARETTPPQELEEDGTLAREAHMAQAISAACQTHSRVLVVTGGFHTWGLLHPVEVPPPSEQFPDGTEQVYPMVYSMEAADALSGYASGMPAPGFYHRVWEKLHGEEADQAYSQSVLELLAAAGRKLRHKGEALSVADETCALDMARGLARLRGKAQPGLYELQDGVLSAFVKGETTAAACLPLEVLRSLTTGDQVGVLPDDALIPPLASDFQAQCTRLGLSLKTAQRQQSTLSIFSSPKHREVSRFFHRTVFLDCGFATLSKGPDLVNQKNRSLIRELWVWRWSGSVMAALVDQSVSGGTVEEACTLLLERKMAQTSLVGDGAKLLVSGFLMGLEDRNGTLHTKLRELAAGDGDFFSLARACAHLNTLLEMGRLYQQTDSYDYAGLLDQCFGRVLTLLPSMAAVKDAQFIDCLSLTTQLYQLSGRPAFASRRAGLLSALTRMLADPDLHPGLHGGILGLLYGDDPAWREEIEAACGGYLRGTRERMLQSAAFLRGLFSTARDLVLVSREFLPALDHLLSRLDEEDFLALLPELRLAFRYFTPMEAARIARKAAGLHGVAVEQLRRPAGQPGQYAYGEALDAWAAARL